MDLQKFEQDWIPECGVVSDNSRCEVVWRGGEK